MKTLRGRVVQKLGSDLHNKVHVRTVVYLRVLIYKSQATL